MPQTNELLLITTSYDRERPAKAYSHGVYAIIRNRPKGWYASIFLHEGGRTEPSATEDRPSLRELLAYLAAVQKQLDQPVKLMIAERWREQLQDATRTTPITLTSIAAE